MEMTMLNFMTKEQFLGLVRHAVTFLGGVIVAKGNFDPTVLDTVAGIGVSIAGLVWSAMAPEKTMNAERILAAMHPEKVQAIEKAIDKVG